MTLFKEVETVQVKTRWERRARLVSQLTGAPLHETLCFLFSLLWSGQNFKLMARIKFTAPCHAGICSSGRPGRCGREKRGEQELAVRAYPPNYGWAKNWMHLPKACAPFWLSSLQWQPAKEAPSPSLDHRALKHSSQRWRGEGEGAALFSWEDFCRGAKAKKNKPTLLQS